MANVIQIKEVTLGEGIPKICVPLTARTRKELCEEAKTAGEAEPDVIEWRADFYEDLSDVRKVTETLQELVRTLAGIPLLFTIRTSAEGGQAELPVSDYAAINEQVARSQLADLIDVEVFGDGEEKKALIRRIQEKNIPVIGSSHDFSKTGTCEELLGRFRRMDEAGADILKLAVMPVKFGDVTAIMDATYEMSQRTKKPLISMSMGGLGSISRLSGELFGSVLTFGTVGTASAPGQFPIRELRRILQTIHERQ